MIQGMFDALFGGPAVYSLSGQANASEQLLRQMQEVYSDANASFLTWNTVAVQPGIYWRRTGGKSWRVTVQR
jgi:hypothetical protein